MDEEEVKWTMPEVMELTINVVTEELVTGALNVSGAKVVQRVRDVLDMMIDMPEVLDHKAVMAGACVYAAHQRAIERFEQHAAMLKDPFRGEPIKPVEGQKQDGVEKE